MKLFENVLAESNAGNGNYNRTGDTFSLLIHACIWSSVKRV